MGDFYFAPNPVRASSNFLLLPVEGFIIYIWSMKFLLLIPLFFLLSCSGCKKDDKYPERTIIGTWVSQDPILQFPIKNTKGEGKVVTFLQCDKGADKILKVSYPNAEGVPTEDNYLIFWIGKNEMVLIDQKDTTNKHINFVRMRE